MYFCAMKICENTALFDINFENDMTGSIYVIFDRPLLIPFERVQ